MYDKIRLKLYDLPVDYSWQAVLNRIGAQSYFADNTGGSGVWRGRRVIATETYVSFEGSLPKCLYGHFVIKGSRGTYYAAKQRLGCPYV